MFLSIVFSLKDSIKYKYRGFPNNDSSYSTRNESSKARLMFPYLLQSLSSSSSSPSHFDVQVATVPSWMFLEWLPQLLSYISSPEIGPSAAKIVRIVAREYPGALTYTWRLDLLNIDLSDILIF